MEQLLLQLFVLPINHGYAQDDSTWVELSTEKGSYRTKRNVIKLELTPFTTKQLKITINGGPIRVFNLRIEYADGSNRTHLINRVFFHKERTKVLSLKKHNPKVKTVSITYKRLVNHKQRPLFLLYGKK